MVPGSSRAPTSPGDGSGGWLSALPLAIPSYVAAWGWIGWRPDLAGWLGAWIVLTSVSYPFVYLPVLGALRRADPALEEVARSLGRRPVQVFLGVTLPEVRIAATAGALLVGLYALSDFGAVSIMRFEGLTHAIYQSYRASFDRTPAAVLGCLLVAVSLVIVAAALRVGAHPQAARRRRRAASRPADRPRPLALAGGRRRRRRARGEHRRADAQSGDLAGTRQLDHRLVGVVRCHRGHARPSPWSRPSSRSPWPCPWRSCRRAIPGRLSRGVTQLAYGGHALPGIVIAWRSCSSASASPSPLYQRTPMLVFAYVVLFLSLALGAIHNAIAQAPPVLDDVARSLGRSQWQAWTAVTLRLALPGVGVAAALVCLAVMKELPATLLLHPIGMETLATRLWGLTSAASYAAAAPYAATIIVVAAIPTAVLTRVAVTREDRP